MRKTIMVAGGLAAATTLIVLGAGAANANVAVENGVGYVGKGDVQSKLGYANDAALQAAFTKGEIKFSGGTATAERIITDYTVSCWGSDAVAHRIFYMPGT